MLKIAHLTKTFGEKKAVDDLSLEIAPGEIYGFHRPQRRGQNHYAQVNRGHISSSMQVKSRSAAFP